MRKFGWLFFVLMTIGAPGYADNLSLDDKLTFRHWDGAEEFSIYLGKSYSDPCGYIMAAEGKFANEEYVVRRIMLVSEILKCDSRTTLVGKYILAKDKVVLAAAIRLAISLPEAEKRKIAPEILKIKKLEKDSLVLTEIQKFIDSLK